MFNPTSRMHTSRLITRRYNQESTNSQIKTGSEEVNLGASLSCCSSNLPSCFSSIHNDSSIHNVESTRSSFLSFLESSFKFQFIALRCRKETDVYKNVYKKNKAFTKARCERKLGYNKVTFPLLQKNTFHYYCSCTTLKTSLLGPNCCSNAILAESQACSSDASSNCIASCPPSSSKKVIQISISCTLFCLKANSVQRDITLALRPGDTLYILKEITFKLTSRLAAP